MVKGGYVRGRIHPTDRARGQTVAVPAAVAAPWQSCPDHPLVGMETAAPGPGHAMSLPETPSDTCSSSATVILGRSRGLTAIRRPRGSERGRARTPALCRRCAGRRGQRRAASVCGQGGTLGAACCRRDRTTAAAASLRRRCHWGRSGPAVGRTWGTLPIPLFRARRRRRPVRTSSTRRAYTVLLSSKYLEKRGGSWRVPSGGHLVRGRQPDTSDRPL